MGAEASKQSENSNSYTEYNKNDPFVSLPIDVQQQILIYLDLHSLANVACVCKHWNRMTQNQKIWEILFVQTFGRINNDYVRMKGLTWKYLFKTTFKGGFTNTTDQKNSSVLARFAHLVHKSKHLSCLVVGLDNAGKTTLLFSLRSLQTAIPTIGFQVETIQYKNVDFTAMDIAQNSKMRPLWRHYFAYANAIMWVVDSSDRPRLQDSVDAFQIVMEELKGAERWNSELRLLVISSKRDLPDCIPLAEIIDAFNLMSLGVLWNCVGLQKDDPTALLRSLDWLADA